MIVTVRIRSDLLRQVRGDLHRPHQFAWERVGFMIAAAAGTGSRILLPVRTYLPVSDDDYERCSGVGAQIGSSAIRSALQAAYRPQSALLHVHSHGGLGMPAFSGVDLASAHEFVPSFFNTLPKMPQGLVVLSNDNATGLLWHGSDQPPIKITHFSQVGSAIHRDWRSA